MCHSLDVDHSLSEEMRISNSAETILKALHEFQEK